MAYGIFKIDGVVPEKITVIENGIERPISSLVSQNTSIWCRQMEYVDLGLPSGVKWSKYPLGATNELEKGWEIVWGEMFPKKVYTQDTADRYNYSLDELEQLGVINRLSSTGGELTELFDCARYHLGKPWRIPTNQNWQELNRYTTREYVYINDIRYFKATSTVNGNYLLFHCQDKAVCGLCLYINDYTENSKYESRYMGYFYIVYNHPTSTGGLYNFWANACSTYRPQPVRPVYLPET